MKSTAENNPTHIVKADVFDALGFSTPEASALKIKSELLSSILEEVKMNNYTEAQLIDVLDEYRPVIRNMLRGRLSLISIEKLLRYAHRLQLQIRITVRCIEGRRSVGYMTGEIELRNAKRKKSHRRHSFQRTSRS